VVGVVPGSDTKLRHEYVVFTAHLDHLGIGPAVDGDNIYNGALDNGAGSSVLLEVSRFFAALPVRPRRSVAFVAMTGEEQGLLGSECFARASPLNGSIVANINVDGGAFFFPVKDVTALGEDHSSLGRIASRAAAETGFEVSPDYFPDEGYFIRSDQFSFIQTGVPSLFIDLGFKTDKLGVDPLATMKKWSVTTYHSPKDDANQPIDYETSSRFARFAAVLTYYVANDPERPIWNPNDFFCKKFCRRDTPSTTR
jgi:Zn-dependent M28 family amino/carboxypeptidase